MALAEDAASVLEQFVQDVANLPAEIAHLLEEIQAKDKIIQECRTTINARDNSIQKFVRLNGSLVPNPKEDSYAKVVLQNYDRAQTLQDEKVGLSEKASVLLDRQIRRLDLKIRDLQNEGTMIADPPLPSLLNPSSTGQASMSTTPVTGASTPLNPVSSNVVACTTLAKSILTRLTHPQPPHQRTGSPGSAVAAQNPLVGMLAQQAVHSAPTSPGATATGGAQGRHRESSAGASDTKRRRLLNSHHLGSVPAHSSNLARQSSLGPGTPKTGTPTGSGTRSGSAGPRAALKKTGGAANKKLAPHQQAAARSRKAAAASSNKSSGLHRKATKRHLAAATDGHDESGFSEATNGSRSSPSDGGDDEDDDIPLTPGRLGSNHPSSLSRHLGLTTATSATAASAADDEDELMDDEEGGDDRKYCFCRNVSHGNMVACDNDDCPYEWFHWGCVGMTKEPVGKWFCPECRVKMGGGAAGGGGSAAGGGGGAGGAG